MAQPLRIGIAGAGRIVRAEHAPRFRAIDGVELAAVANRTLESSKRAAADLGIPRALADWGELVLDEEIDAVMVGAWPHLHAAMTIAALEAGKHVLTEARLAVDSVEAAAIVESALAHPGQVAMVVPGSFSLWADRAIMRVLGDGSIGRLLGVRVVWGAGADDPAEHWRWQRRYSGSNTMALGIVYESLARWLGQAEWLSAETRIIQPRKPGPDGRLIPTDIPDHVLAIVGFPGEVLVNVEMSVRSLRGHGNAAHFFGTDGTLEIDFTKQKMEIRDMAGVARPVEIAPSERDEWRVERDFVAAIRGQQIDEQTDLATAVRYMRFVDAVHESSWSGERVVLAIE